RRASAASTSRRSRTTTARPASSNGDGGRCFLRWSVVDDCQLGTDDSMTKYVLLAGGLGWLVSSDWVIGACLIVVELGEAVLQPDEGPPLIALACSRQWVAVCVGLFYFAATERPLDATIHSDYRTMVEIGLGCLLAMIAGLYVGRRLVGLAGPAKGLRPA